jgi:hypothetical protein
VRTSVRPPLTPTQRFQITLGLASVAAILLVISVLTKSWLVNDQLKLEIGPIGATSCVVKNLDLDVDQHGDVERMRPRFKSAGMCTPESMSNSELVDQLQKSIAHWATYGSMSLPAHVRKDEFVDKLGKLTSSRLGPIGTATLVLSLVLAAALIAGAAVRLFLKKRVPVITGRSGIILLITDLFLGGAFLVYRPGPKGWATFSWGAYMFVIAAVLGIIALRYAELTERLERSAE